MLLERFYEVPLRFTFYVTQNQSVMLNRLALLFILVLPATVAVAQDHMMHTMGEGDSLAHRMPPMDMARSTTP